MRTVQTKVYTFSELSETAKSRAKSDHKSDCGFCWADEYTESIKKLAERFDGRMSDWSINWEMGNASWAKFEMPEMDRGDIASILSELGTCNPVTLKGDGECKLTGFCADEDAIDGFRKAFVGGQDHLGELMYAAFESLVLAGAEDFKGQYSDSEFRETCDANEYEFYADGSMV